MKKYQIIYADPPWKYSFSKTNNRKIENQYPTMNQKELCALDIPSDDNAALYLWATAPKLIEALEVMNAWGFSYKTNAVWDKKKIGMGYWFRGQHELLLVGTKGKFSPPTQKDRTSSVFEFPRGIHSKKPDEIRNLIKKWFPDLQRVELFCRFPSDGWDVWGNEIEPTAQINYKS